MKLVVVAQIKDRIARLGIPGYGEDEIEFIVQTLRLAKPKAIFEWGTNYGASARIFHEAASILKLDCVIHTTELPIELAGISPEHAGTNTGVIFHGIDSIVRHTGDGVTESLLAYRQGGSPRSLFFLDGDHTTENVLRELRWVHAVAPKAIILVHDVSPDRQPHSHAHGPHRALEQFRRECGAYLVKIVASQAGMARLSP